MKLVQQYHPDKHMSASGEQRARAEAKFKNVQEAYALLTSKDRVQIPARWAQAEAEYAASMQRSAFTNRQAAIWVAGGCFLSAAFLAFWTAVRSRGDGLASEDRQQVSARERYIHQAKQWERNMSSEQVRQRMDDRRDLSVKRAMSAGIDGAVVYTTAAATVLGIAKAVQYSGVAKAILSYPLVSFHLRPPALCFYATSAGIYGFYDRGLNTVSPKGRLHKYVGEDDFEDSQRR